MRAKPWITCGLLAGVRRCPSRRLRWASAGSPSIPVSASRCRRAIELTAAQKDELDSLSAKVADPSVYRENNVQYPGALSRARVSVERGPNGQPLPQGHDTAGGQRAVPRSDRRGQLGDRSRRARLHVPARSAGYDRRAGAAPVEPVGAGRAGGARRSARARRGGIAARPRQRAPTAQATETPTR